jgi:hypothetical protein
MEKITKYKEDFISAIERIRKQYIDDFRKTCYSALDSATRRVIEIYEKNVREYGYFTIETLGKRYLVMPLSTITIKRIGEEMKERLCERTTNLPKEAEKEALKEFAMFFENEAKHYKNNLNKKDESMYLILSQTAKELRRIIEKLYNVNISEAYYQEKENKYRKLFKY